MQTRFSTYIIVILCCLTYVSSHSQIVIGDEQLFVSGNEAIISTTQDVKNEGTIEHDGLLLLSSNWVNTGTFEEKNGIIELTGSNEQIINHNGSSFNKLIVNGDSYKRFISEASIKTLLSLKSGIITPINQTKFIALENCTIEGGSEKSNIDGIFYHEGIGNKFFPISYNGTYNPAYLKIIEATNNLVGLHVIESNYQAVFSEGIERISENNFWQLHQAEGSIDKAYISLFYGNEDYSNLSDLVITEAMEPNGEYNSLGSSDFKDEKNYFLESEQPISQVFFSFGYIPPFKISKILTPDGDGINDFLTVSNMGQCDDNKLTIFNRLGQIVFETSNYNNDWNGKINGQFLPEGNYFCLFKSACHTKPATQTISIIH